MMQTEEGSEEDSKRVEEALVLIHENCLALESIDNSAFGTSVDVKLFAARTRRQAAALLNELAAIKLARKRCGRPSETTHSSDSEAA
jgi:hypothetical protein